MYDTLLHVAEVIKADRFLQTLIIVNTAICVCYVYHEIKYVRRKEREYREEMEWLVKYHQWKADNARDSVQH
jgi:hypothetical protein